MDTQARKGISILIASLLIVGIVIAGGVVFFASPKLSGFMLSDYPTTLTSGEPFSVTVTALDQYGKPYTSTTDPVYFQSSDSNAVIPQPGTTTNPYTFTSADNGVHTFNGFMLISVESSTITVTDGKKTETSNPITVNDAPILDHFEFDPINSPVTAGENFDIKVTAVDQCGNLLASYSGTPTLTYSEGSIYPTTITSWFSGVGTATVRVQEAGNGVTITATDNPASGTSDPFDVHSIIGITLDVRIIPFYVSSFHLDLPFTIEVTAKDQYGNNEKGYTGTVHFTSNDPLAILPSDFTFGPENIGGKRFSITLKTVLDWSVTVTDTLTPSLTGFVSGVARMRNIDFVSIGYPVNSYQYGSLYPKYPENLRLNDLILMQVVGESNYPPPTPAGFTLLYGPDQAGFFSQWIFYRFADGTEIGEMVYHYVAPCEKVAVMVAYRNVALTDFVEDGSFGSGVSNIILAQSVTTTGYDRLAISFIFMGNFGGPMMYIEGSFYGSSGGDWTNHYNGPIESYGHTTKTGPQLNRAIAWQTAYMEDAGTISGGSNKITDAVFVPLIGSFDWGVRAFALIPAS